MDIYARFDLPLPPPPTIFSRDHSASRGRFPELENVDQLVDLVWRIVSWPVSKVSYAILPFQIGYMVLLEAVYFFIIFHQIRKRNWWLFRFSRRNHGNVIIPHVHNVFTLIVAVYIAVMIGFYARAYACHRQNMPLPHRGAYFSFLWIPLAFAVWYQALAIYQANANSRKSAPSPRDSPVTQRTFPPCVLNIVSLAFPLISVVICIAPGILSEKYLEDARHGWIAWTEKYGSATELSREMLLDAHQIWTSQLHGSFYFVITSILWACICLSLGVAHLVAAVRLMRNVRQYFKEMRKQDVLTQRRPKAPELPRLETPPQEPDRAMHYQYRYMQRTLCIAWNKSYNRPNASTAEIFGAMSTTCPSGTRGEWTHEDDEIESVMIRSGIFTAEEEERNRTEFFFPTVKPSSSVHRMSEGRADKVMFYFVVQFLSIAGGVLGFISLLTYTSFNTYAGMEAGDPAHMNTVAWQMLTFLLLGLGTSTAISTSHSFFEASFSALVNADHSILPKFARGQALPRAGSPESAAPIAPNSTHIPVSHRKRGEAARSDEMRMTSAFFDD